MISREYNVRIYLVMLMFANTHDFGLKIITVTRLTWDGGLYKVAPRSSNALVFRIKGTASFRFNNSTEIITREGEVFFCPAHIGYDVEYDDGEIIVFHFFADGLPSVPSVKSFTYTSRIKDMFLNAVEVWEEHGKGFYYKALSIFFDILSVCSSETVAHYDFRKDYLYASDFLRDNALMSDLSVSEVCRKYMISETGFRRYFGELFGTSPIKYINEIRIREAEKLLIGTKMRVEDIAYRCGFNDVKYFSRVFSKYRGCPPSEFRKC